MHPSLLSISNFSYDLPEDRIALYPAAGRDDSKLLVYKNEEILITEFRNIITYLPDEALLIFNDTKVINARIIFQKNTGSKIEIFCLEPADYSFDLKQYGRTEWVCLIGGAAKWKGESLQKEVQTLLSIADHAEWWPDILRCLPNVGKTRSIEPEQMLLWNAIKSGNAPWVAALRTATDVVIDRIAWISVQELTPQYEAMCVSTLWKLIKPLRVIAKGLRRLLQSCSKIWVHRHS